MRIFASLSHYGKIQNRDFINLFFHISQHNHSTGAQCPKSLILRSSNSNSSSNYNISEKIKRNSYIYWIKDEMLTKKKKINAVPFFVGLAF